MQVSAIIPAAGQGKRMGGKRNKQYLTLGKDMVLTLTLHQLDKIQEITELIVVVREVDLEFCRREIFAKEQFQTPYKLISGGKERQDSVKAGLAVLSQNTNYVLIHDGARPLITEKLIKDALVAAQTYGAAVVSVPLKDTIKIVDSKGFIESTPDRSTLRAVQTPQVFSRELICRAYEFATELSYLGTDDASLVEAMQEQVVVISGSYENIKITTPEDVLLAEEILRKRRISD